MAKFSEIEIAFDFVSSAAPSDNAAYISTATGETYWHSELGDNVDPLPEDIDEPVRYIAIPHKNELGLGKPLAMTFSARELPNDLEKLQRYSGAGEPTVVSRPCSSAAVSLKRGTNSKIRVNAKH